MIRDFRRSVLRDDDARIGALAPRAIDGHSLEPRQLTFPSDGRDLAGFLYLPPGAGPFPAMVVNHGSGVHQGSTEICRPGIAALLASWGIACLMPNRRGYGNSPGTPWREDVSATFGTEAYDKALVRRLDGESDDVVAAGGFLAGLAEIDGGHVGVMGSSFGGIVTLLAASKSDRFRCSVDFAGAAMNWERTPVLRDTMIAAARRLTRPACFLQAANDYCVRPTLEIAAALAGQRQGHREPRLSRLRPDPRRGPFPLPRRHRRVERARARLPAALALTGRLACVESISQT